MVRRTYVHVRERDRLRAVARKGWMGRSDAFDSLVTVAPCFESTRPTRVGKGDCSSAPSREIFQFRATLHV